jgi:LysM repeat protein
MSLITVTPLAFPNAALTLPLGKKKPTFSDGIAQWNTVARPRRRSLTEFDTELPLRYSFDVKLDAFPDGDVESLIRRIVGWAARLDLPYQPTLLQVSGPIVYPDVTYYLDKVDQVDDEVMMHNSGGRICRQLLDLEIAEYVAPDLVIQTPPPAQAAQERVAETPAERTYVVVQGDTLWAIAARLLGNGNRWHELADGNGVRDPRKLQIGQVLKVPNA